MAEDNYRESSIFGKLLTKSVPHLLEKIFLNLDYESYKACHEVCITWNQLLLSESFKKRAKAIYQEEILKDHTKLCSSSKAGDLAEVRRILSTEMVDVNCLTKRSTPLCQAAHMGHKDIAELLLERGAEPNKADADGITPLYLAPTWRGKEIHQLLIDRGVDPNQAIPFHKHQNPLYLAASFGNQDLVKVLLDGGALPTIANRRGQTPLHVAAKENRIDVIKMLLERGAEPNKVDTQGQTALHWVAKETPWPSRGSQAEVVKLLIDGGADPNKEDHDDQTPLQHALQHGHEDMVKALKDSGAVST